MSKTHIEENQEGTTARQPEMAADSFCHTLDQQSRLTIPGEWRPMIGIKVAMLVVPEPDTKKLKVMLPLRTQEFFETLRQKESEIMGEDADAIEDFFANSQNITMDAAGRIRICDRLLEYAGITKDVTLRGAGRYIVLSAADASKQGEASPNSATFKNSLVKMGLMK